MVQTYEERSNLTVPTKALPTFSLADPTHSLSKSIARPPPHLVVPPLCSTSQQSYTSAFRHLSSVHPSTTHIQLNETLLEQVSVGARVADADADFDADAGTHADTHAQ